jgi:hypothetical protein
MINNLTLNHNYKFILNYFSKHKNHFDTIMNTFEMCDLDVAPTNEKHLIDSQALNFNLTTIKT